MAQIITLSDIESADNSDILQGTRLQTVPQGGFLTFELQSSSNDATNYFTTSIQMPNGDTPLNTVRVPSGDGTGELDERKKLMITLPVAQGGHAVFSVDETGTAVLAWRVTYTPA
ncbi:MAG: hypothetical protein VW907_10840 [Opitutae bacterium]